MKNYQKPAITTIENSFSERVLCCLESGEIENTKIGKVVYCYGPSIICINCPAALKSTCKYL